LYGNYFNYKTIDGVIERAKYFVGFYNHENFMKRGAPQESPEGQPILLRKIFHSNCYELIDGHHRAAIHIMQGQGHIPCHIVDMEPSVTLAQEKIIFSSWTDREPILYQPIELPEVSNWPTVRRCEDRLSMMLEYLQGVSKHLTTYIDLGCSYGWFVQKMQYAGYASFGVDRDVNATDLGCMVYGLQKKQVIIEDVENFVQRSNVKYDIVSCYSVLHHFVTGRSGKITAKDFIKFVDQITGSVLFFDMGEEHEEWFRQTLKGWNAKFIRQWLLDNTTFTYVEPLGKDKDSVGRYADQYGRHLFVCTRE
jgi:SAM-dependent methyltransferase